MSGIPPSKITKTSEMRSRCRGGLLRGSERGGDGERVQSQRKHKGQQLEHQLGLSRRPYPGSGCRGCSGVPSRACGQVLRMLTARAMTSAPMASDTEDCTSMVSFAHLANGITSVGLNAVALVNDRYR